MVDPLLPGRYAVGAASVDAGGTIVTPTGATWTDNVWGDDLFFLPSQPLVPPQRVESADPLDGTIVLAYPWPGAAATEEIYEVRYVGIIERSTAQSRRVLEQLGDVKAWYDIIVEDDATRLALESPTSPLRAGYRVLVKDDGVIWAKETSAYGDWVGPVEFKGDTGQKGWSPEIVTQADGERRVLKLAGYVGGEGAAPTDHVGQYLKADGTWTNTIGDAADFRGEGFIFRGPYNGATAYAKGNVVRSAGSSWIAIQATTGNAPPALPTTSNAEWALLAQKGADGAGTGDVVGPVSSTARRIAVFADVTGKLLDEASGLTDAQKLQAVNDIGAVGFAGDQSAQTLSAAQKRLLTKNSLQTWETIAHIASAVNVPAITLTGLDYTKIRVRGLLIPVSTGSSVGWQLSDDNGTTWKTAYSRTLRGVWTNTASQNTEPGNPYIYMNSVQALANTQWADFRIEFEALKQPTIQTRNAGDIQFFGNVATDLISTYFNGTANAAYVTNAIRLVASLGNITVVDLTIEGVR